MRRVLADFSEAPFYGNEWASLGLILGALLAFTLNPASPVYGSMLLPQLIGAQALTSAIGVVIWRRNWMEHGWYPTYIPIVSIVPAAVLIHGGDWQVVVASAVLGALVSGLAGGIAPDDGTVLLEGRDGNGEVAQHGDGKRGCRMPGDRLRAQV